MSSERFLRAPLAVRVAALAAFVVACVHIVFGAVVRISGSGMGCQDSWPKCKHPDGQTYWFPPMDNPQIVIEWTHRLLASLLLVEAELVAEQPARVTTAAAARASPVRVRLYCTGVPSEFGSDPSGRSG